MFTTKDTDSKRHQRLYILAPAVLATALLFGFACSTSEPLYQQVDDATIATKIEARLGADPQVNNFNIDVDVAEGVVTLSGIIETDTARMEAEKLAHATKGVRSVNNELTIGTQTVGDRLSDASITAKVKAKLTGDPDINPFNIDVDTLQGVVTLRGTVATSSSKQRAEELAGETTGVQRVHNELKVVEAS